MSYICATFSKVTNHRHIDQKYDNTMHDVLLQKTLCFINGFHMNYPFLAFVIILSRFKAHYNMKKMNQHNVHGILTKL